MNEESAKQIELLKTIQRMETRAEKRKTEVDSTVIIREARER